METLKAEWIPAHLDFDGPAKVSDYFDSRVIDKGDGKYRGFFRGHEMLGKEVKLPDDYHMCTVDVGGKTITPVEELTPVRVWDLDAPSLDMAMQFTDVVTVARLLADD